MHALFDEHFERNLELNPLSATFIGQPHSDCVDIWFRNALLGEDQLRQQVALSLSKIMVVSQLRVLQ